MEQNNRPCLYLIKIFLLLNANIDFFNNILPVRDIELKQQKINGNTEMIMIIIITKK